MKITQSKINQLIAELCPNGIEFLELDKVAKITIGEFVHKTNRIQMENTLSLTAEELRQDFIMSLIIVEIR